jgi:hypothetical protein
MPPRDGHPGTERRDGVTTDDTVLLRDVRAEHGQWNPGPT